MSSPTDIVPFLRGNSSPYNLMRSPSHMRSIVDKTIQFRYQAIRIWVVGKVRKNGHVKGVPKENEEVKD